MQGTPQWPGAEKGEKCPEGFSFYALPGPGFQGDPSAEENPYYVWVDQLISWGSGPMYQSQPGISQTPCTHSSAAK